TRVTGDVAQGRPPADSPGVIHEDRVSARLEDPVRLAEEPIRRRVDVERMDADDLIECAVTERVAARELTVAEGQGRERPRATLFPRDLDERAIAVEPGH